MHSGDKLAEFVRSKRAGRGWTQDQLASAARVSIDTVRRCEAGLYTLPKRPRARGHVLDSLARALGFEPCDVVRTCFTPGAVRSSDYRRCLDTNRKPTRVGQKRHKSFRDYVSELSQGADELVAQAAMLNAQAIAFLINLEKQFSAFEFLITNQPPFMLFADDEYVTTGSASVQLDEADREAYHALVFSHREYVRDLTSRGHKHYRVVLHKQSLIAFLNSRVVVRAANIVADMKSFLHYDGFDLVIMEASEPFDEFELLSKTYPFRPGVEKSAISVRHRRIGLGNTAVYQLALVGSNHELVNEDHARADSLWRQGLAQMEELATGPLDLRHHQYPLRHKRVAARLLEDALKTAHP